jgi:hypothetical protein
VGKIVKHKPLPQQMKLWLVIAGQHEIEGVALVHAADEDEALQKGHERFDLDSKKEAAEAGILDKEMAKLMEAFHVEEHEATLEVFDIAAITKDGDWEFEECEDE